MLRWFLFLIAILTQSVFSAAEAQRDIRWKRLGTEEGLSQGTVICMLQDRTGYLWLGTQDGLNRFDGHEMVSFKNDPRDPDTLRNDWIWALFEDSFGDLWIGTGAGLSRRRPSEGRFHHLLSGGPEGLIDDEVRALAEDAKGGLWIGTASSGLSRYELSSGKITHRRHDPEDPESLGNDEVRTLLVGQRGRLWVGTQGGLDVFDPKDGTFRRLLKGERVRALLEARDGVIWVGTIGSGTYRFDPDTLESRRATPENSGETVRAVFEDSEGRLWFGTDLGLELFDRDLGKILRRYVHSPVDPSGLSSGRISSILQDRSGLIWIGTQHGLNQWNPRSWSFHHFRYAPEQSDGLSHRQVLAISQGQDDRVWIGTFGGGLNRLDSDRQRVQVLRHDPDDPTSLTDDRVTALLHDHRGDLWVGTQRGLNFLDADSEKHFRRIFHRPDDADSLSHNAISALFEDSRDALWIGTFGGGLNRLDRPGNKFSHWTQESHGLEDDRVAVVREGPEGRLWVGTFGGGLSRMESKNGSDSFVRFSLPGEQGGLLSETVFALHFQEDSLWVGTAAGLYRLNLPSEDPGMATFEAYLERDGLPNDVIYAIEPDTEGRLWLSTNHGLSQFDPESREFRNFDVSHGLQSNDFNMGAHYRSAKGELFFGGENGLNAFLPEAIEATSTAPNLVLASFSLFHRPMELAHPVGHLSELILDYEDRFFSFQVAALDFTAPEKNRFLYRLEGLHEDWWPTRREIVFTNLDPGSYLLRVRGANSDGVWNEEGVSLPIIIRPPFYRTWWFQLILLAIFLVAGGAFFRARTAEIEARAASAAKSEFLAVMTHELRTPLNGISGMSYILGRSRLLHEDLREHVAIIGRSCDHLLSVVNDILDFSKIEARALELEEHVFSLHRMIHSRVVPFRAQAEVAGIELKLRIDPQVPHHVIGDSTRLGQILTNLISNALKFTEQGEVEVSAEIQAKKPQAKKPQPKKPQPKKPQPKKPQAKNVQLSGKQQSEPLSPIGGVLEESESVELLVSVRDTGMGIEPKQRIHLFEAFSQADRSISRKFGGTGLGLAISKQFLELMGGTIHCESEKGVGTRFFFTVELKLASETGSLDSQEFNVDTNFAQEHPHHILIVEDDQINQLVLHTVLLDLGYAADIASSGEEALTMAAADEYDLIFLDLHMPDMDGFEATVRLRELELKHSFRIIATTASATLETRERCLAEGMDDFITKPLRLHVLLEMLAARPGNFSSTSPGFPE